MLGDVRGVGRDSGGCVRLRRVRGVGVVVQMIKKFLKGFLIFFVVCVAHGQPRRISETCSSSGDVATLSKTQKKKSPAKGLLVCAGVVAAVSGVKKNLWHGNHFPVIIITV